MVKMRKYILLGILSVVLIGCSNTSSKIELTPSEIREVENNQNEIAGILIKKAILKDMNGYKYDREEKEALDEAKENLEIEFYMNRLAVKKVNVSDEEVLAIYNANKDKLKDIKMEIALPQIREQLFLQKVNNEKINYINSLIEKNQLNDKIKLYFPKEKK